MCITMIQVSINEHILHMQNIYLHFTFANYTNDFLFDIQKAEDLEVAKKLGANFFGCEDLVKQV